MVTSYIKGNSIYYDFDILAWRYIFNDEVVNLKDCLVCPKCEKVTNINDPDCCLDLLKDVKSACCGHGVEKGFRI